jgi:hypothetical protein
MTIAYSINGGAEIHGVHSTWRRIPIRTSADSSIDFSAWADNVWQIEALPVAGWLELQAARGAALTSLQTNDIDDNNAAAGYGTAILYSLSSGGHVGVNMLQVEVIFRVKTV